MNSFSKTLFTDRNNNHTISEDNHIVHKTGEDSLYNSKNFLMGCKVNVIFIIF
jgi:hypothetical protein